MDEIALIKDILDKIPYMIWIKDIQGKYVFVNKTFAEVCGNQKESIIGKTDFEVWSEELALQYVEYDKLLLKVGKEMQIEEQIREKGVNKWFEVCKVPMYDELGHIIGIASIAKNITKRKALENEVKNQKQFLKSIIDAIPDFIFYKDTESAYVGCNKSFSKDFIGLNEDEIIGKTDFDILKDKELAGFFRQKDIEMFEAGETKVNEESIELKNGNIIDVETIKTPLRNENGQIKGVLGIARDITERNLIMDELKKDEKIFSAVAMSIKELIDNDNYFDAIEKCFALLGQATNVDRVYLFVNSYDEFENGTTTQKIEWNSEYSEPQLYNQDLINIPFDEIKSFIEPLLKRKAYHGIVRKLENDNTRIMLEEQNILSIIVLPIYVRNKFWGFIGFDECKYEREWKESEFSILSAFNNSVEKTIERGLMEQDLEISKAKAEEANIIKSQFLANISHEIRTPINAIIGYTTILQDIVTDNIGRSYLNSIQKAGNVLISLINDILDLSKIKFGKLEIQKSNVDIYGILEEVKDIFSLKVENKNLRFNIFINSKIPKILVMDGVRFRQILFNLIGNAVKFTEKGSVDVFVEINDNENVENELELIIEVKDTGIGIPKEQQVAIFESFKQQYGQNNKRYGGTGLGLSITKRLVEMMSGTIKLYSEINEGSSFIVILPNIEVGKLARSMSNVAQNEIYEGNPKSTIKLQAITNVINADNEKAEDISEKLIIELEEAFTGLWSNCVKSYRISTVREFSKLLNEIGNRFNNMKLKEYSDELLGFVNSFNSKKIRDLLQQYPEILDEFKAIWQRGGGI